MRSKCDNLHQEIKKTTYNSKRKPNMREASGRIIYEEGEKLQEWERCIKEMFADERHFVDAKNDYIERPEILKSRILDVTYQPKNNKSPGPD
ncbi:hypothetical protein Trydic_g21595 [Trypoxylus dichotomus]